jgi:hypothetical protein
VEDASQLADTMLEQVLYSPTRKDVKDAETMQDQQGHEEMAIDSEEEEVAEARNKDKPSSIEPKAQENPKSSNSTPKEAPMTRSPPGFKNVSFADAANSQSLRRGNTSQPAPNKSIPANPYTKK